MSELVVLTEVPNRSLGELLAEMLADHSIEAHVKSDDCGGLDPALNFVNGTQVFVRGGDLSRASSLLEEFEASVEEQAEDEPED